MCTSLESLKTYGKMVFGMEDIFKKVNAFVRTREEASLGRGRWQTVFQTQNITLTNPSGNPETVWAFMFPSGDVMKLSTESV